jgi:hypothetical protein
MRKKRSTALDTYRAGPVPAPAYVPTAQEKASIERARGRRAQLAPAIRFKLKAADGGIPEISPDHPEPAVAHAVMLDAIGSGDFDFLEGLILQLVNVGSKGQKIDEKELNFLFSIVKGVGPRDQLESLLSAQMAAVHNAVMTFARRLAHVDTIPQQDSALRGFNALSRTFAAQMDTLKRYRAGPHQTLTVEQVTVNDGGQAIVGNIAVNPAKANENGG